MNVNIVVISGSLARDPELKFIPNGTAVCNLNVAVGQSWRSNTGDKHEKCSFIEVVVWGKTAELCGGLKKGAAVLVKGEIEQQTWEQDGKKRYKTHVKAETVTLTKGDAIPAEVPEPLPMAEMPDLSLG